NLPQKPKFSAAITTPGYKKLIANTLTDPKRQSRFIASITSAVGVNPALQDCEPRSIIASALLGESLNLSPSPQLGQFYMVPFKQKAKYRNGEMIEPECTKATFVLGYKGMVQLAMRSGYYKKIVVLEMKEGEVKSFDPLDETIDCMIITDPDEREKAPTIGYYAMFEYTNGFRKAMYWTREQMLRHADRYSAAFSAAAYEKLQRGEIPERDMWKYSSFWYSDFDTMAKKTMLRQLISHWGAMSTELETAIVSDGNAMRFDGDDIVTDVSAEELPTAEGAPEISVNETPSEEVDIGSL
ncbi:MAG: recombinase RecT, partial [Eubacteriales bacterium]